MRRLLILFGSMALALVLGACSQAPLFSMEGSYMMTVVVSDTNTVGVTVGDVEAFLLTITTAGDQVEMTGGSTFVVTGTRVGNSVELEGPGGGGTDVWSFDLTWINETTFEGTGRAENGPEYVEFEGTGFSSVYLAGL